MNNNITQENHITEGNHIVSTMKTPADHVADSAKVAAKTAIETTGKVVTAATGWLKNAVGNFLSDDNEEQTRTNSFTLGQENTQQQGGKRRRRRSARKSRRKATRKNIRRARKSRRKTNRRRK